MKTETATLHMVRLTLDVPRLLASARLGMLPLREVDLGYLVHWELAALFGDHRPAPFSVRRTHGRFVDVLAYAELDARGLRGVADRADPAADGGACRWDDLASKPMPDRWANGVNFGFEVRACPVVRMAKDGAKHRKGAEVDAFLARCWAVGSGEHVDREGVYAKWLGDLFARRGAGTVTQVRLAAFRRGRFIRRTHTANRKARSVERPDALLRGQVRVGDPIAFGDLVRRGIGRHRGFGFGMLLLRASRASSC
jgi:CRISPR system Cascade subunit CasE